MWLWIHILNVMKYYSVATDEASVMVGIYKWKTVFSVFFLNTFASLKINFKLPSCKYYTSW